MNRIWVGADDSWRGQLRSFWWRLKTALRMGKEPEVEPETESLLPQYSEYFKKKYGLTIWCGGNDLFIKRSDGTVTCLKDADSYVEVFNFIDRIGKTP